MHTRVTLLMRRYACRIWNTLMQNTFKRATDYPIERGPRATERLEELSRTPIQSSRFLSYRFHRPLEISSVKRNAVNRREEGREQATWQGITVVTRDDGRWGKGTRTSGFSINDFEIVCVSGTRLEDGGDKEKKGSGSARTGRDGENRNWESAYIERSGERGEGREE